VELLVVPLVLLVVLMLGTPPLAIYVLWRQRQLREQLAELTKLAAKQNDALHRELLDLKRQLAALPRVAAPPAQPSPEPSLRISAIVPQPEQPAPPPSVVLKPAAPTPTIPVAPVPAPPSTTPVSAATNVGAPGESQKAPAAVPAPAEPKPPAPVVPQKTPAPVQPSVIPPRPPRYVDIPKVPPPPPVTPPVASARVAAPPPVAPLRSAAAHSTAQHRIQSASAIEDALGRNWLNKIGIVLLVVGIASFGIYEFRQLGPQLKDVLLYAVSFAFLGG